MALEFGTRAWSEALCASINDSSEYRNAAAKWGVDGKGNVLLTFQADGRLRDPVHLLLRLKEGRCLGAEFLPSADHPEAAHTLEAPFSIWKDILDGKALAATAILSGKLRVRGDRMALLKYAAANRALLHCVGAMETVYPA